MSTVPMSGPTYNILVHSMLGSKASAKLGKLSLSTMPCKQFLDVCCGLLGQVKTQDRKRQDFISLTPQGPDVLSWWTTISNEGADAGCGIQAIWERFLEYVPNADARFLRWELDTYSKETGNFPIDGQAFIIESLNESLGKCRVIFDLLEKLEKYNLPHLGGGSHKKMFNGNILKYPMLSRHPLDAGESKEKFTVNLKAPLSIII